MQRRLRVYSIIFFSLKKLKVFLVTHRGIHLQHTMSSSFEMSASNGMPVRAAQEIRFDKPRSLNEIALPWTSVKKEKTSDGVVNETRKTGSLAIPAGSYSLFQKDGHPLVGAVFPKGIRMSESILGSTPFPVLSHAPGLSTDPYVPDEDEYEDTAAWRLVNNSKRMSKWRKLYYDDI